MLKNYFKVGLRNLKRNKFHSGINIFGLALGLTAFLMILLFVKEELGYDRHLKDSERIHRVVQNVVIANNTITNPITPSLLAQTMLDDFPEVQETVRMRGPTRESDPVIVEVDNEYFHEKQVIYTDSSFFDFFGVNLMKGDPNTALKNPNSVVLTPETAKKYFKDADPMGKSFRLKGFDEEFQVTGIAEPLPRDTHFHFDILASLITDERSRSAQWLGGFLMTYVKLNSPDQLTMVDAKLAKLVQEKVGPQLENFMGISFSEFQNQGGQYQYFLQPVQDIHLDSNLDIEWEANGNRTYVYILSVVGLIILFLAGINFTNLATSQAAKRAKEIGMRKVLGSQRPQLAGQFVVESLLVSTISTIIALVAFYLLLPSFNNLIGSVFVLSDILSPMLIAVFLSITLILGTAAGLYPAVYLSGFSPRQALAQNVKMEKGSITFKNALVAGQFLISTSLIISTLIIGNQLEYFSTKELGFNKDQILVVRNADVLEESAFSFREELLKKPGIVSASFSTSIPGKGIGRAAYQPENSSETLVLPLMTVDENFLDIYEVPVVQGRTFSADRTNEEISVILNKSAVSNLGFDDPIGKVFNAEMSGAQPLRIIGVIDDFHFQSLHKQIQPLILEYVRPGNILDFLSVKVTAENIDAAISSVENIWKEFVPKHDFNYEFFNQSYENLYQNDKKLGLLIRIFAVLAIFIACLGLLGLTFYATQNRQKEVGIRKVLGSSVSEIVILFMKNMSLLILTGILFALPASYILMENWLQDFAYRVSITAEPFITGGLLTFGIAIISVSFTVIKTALINPAVVLRNN